MDGHEASLCLERREDSANALPRERACGHALLPDDFARGVTMYRDRSRLAVTTVHTVRTIRIVSRIAASSSIPARVRPVIWKRS
jgi:hypothetical protein